MTQAVSSSSDSIIFDEKNIVAIIKVLAVSMAVVPAYIGVGFGLIHGSAGICKAADYSTELIHTIMPMAFISAPSVYGLIMFFVILQKDPVTITDALKALSAGCIEGLGSCYAAYALGNIAKYASVTKAQSKKFGASFFLLMVFGEIIGLFSLIIGIVFLHTGGSK